MEVVHSKFFEIFLKWYLCSTTRSTQTKIIYHATFSILNPTTLYNTLTIIIYIFKNFNLIELIIHYAGLLIY